MEFILAIFAVGLGLIILKRAKIIMATHTHLDDEDLEDYLEGRFSPDSTAYKQAVAHLGVCEKCRKRLRKLEAGDNLV